MLRYPATALAAFAAPEKLWCQAVSKGGHSSGCRGGDASPLLARGLGDSETRPIRWRKDGVQSFEVVAHQTALLAHRLWPNRYAKHRFTSKGLCSRTRRASRRFFQPSNNAANSPSETGISRSPHNSAIGSRSDDQDSGISVTLDANQSFRHVHASGWGESAGRRRIGARAPYRATLGQFTAVRSRPGATA